ncbi:MAG: hypothetical protein HXY44_08175 [Syntrophaceae bacterium]|nr:hypothetical protein [Syntrophaceae bacterium]
MKMRILILVSVLVWLLFPALVSADCLDLGEFTSWVLEDEHTVVFYKQMRPIARLEIPGCSIGPSSNIRLIKSYICDSDEIMIDNEKCNIMTLEVLY